MALEAAQPFVWGGAGAQLTPAQIDAQRKVAQAMMLKGSDYSPIQSPWQGAARVAQAMLGGYESGEADRASKTNSANEAALLSSIFTGGASATATPATPTVASDVAKPAGATAIPAGKDEFVNSIMPMAQEASLKTGVDPRVIVAQAALESGYGQHAPGNNLFGIKSHGAPGGNTLATTEVVDGQPVRTTDSFRAYASPADSVSGYADFINSNPRYAGMKNAAGLDAQVAALGKSGYATDPAYADKVGAIARTLPVPAPQVVDANAPSPLDNAAYPAGPVGAPGTQVAQAAPTPAPATAAAPAATPAAPGVNPALIRAMSSPYVSDGTKKILGLVLTQQMAAAQKASDPGHQLDMKYKQAQIDKMTGKAGTTEYGLNPVYGKDPETGETVIGTIGKDGSFKKIDTGGVKISSGVDKIDLGTHFAIYDKKSGQFLGNQPKDLRGAESEKVLGKAQGTAKSTLSSDLQNSEQTVKQLDDLIKNPGLSSIVGPLDQFRPSYLLGSEGRDALARYNQLKGKAFLQAYTTLRGGGQITEVEGTKAENAMARMDRAQNEDDFKAALTDFRDAVKTGMEKLREKAGVAAPQGKTSSGVSWSVE